MRGQLADAAVLFDANRLKNLDVFARAIEFGDTDLVDGFDEGQGTAIHDRHFVAVDFNIDIVDRQSPQGREQMLDSGNGHPAFATQDRTKLRVRHGANIRRNLSRNIAAAANDEPYSRIHFCRMQNDGNRCPAMNPSASKHDFSRNCRLAGADKALREFCHAVPRPTLLKPESTEVSPQSPHTARLYE